MAKEFKHFKGWIDKESVTVMGWVWAIEEMDTERNDLVVFQIPKESDTNLNMVRKIEKFIADSQQVTIQRCTAKGCNEPAVGDYNGHGDYACEYHMKKWDKEFEDEYR